LFFLWSTTFAVAVEIDEVAPGLVYEHVKKEEGPLSIHVLVVDPNLLRISAARALNDGVGRETVSSIADRVGAVAAVNGGFYSMGGRYDGDPTGVFKTSKGWFSGSHLLRGAIGWTEDARQKTIGRVRTSWQVRFEDSLLSVNGINRARRASETILYMWAFHRSTLTGPAGTEVLVERGKVREIRTGGDSPVPPNGFVCSFGAKVDTSVVEGIEVGMKAEAVPLILSEDESSGLWSRMEYIVGGTPVLAQDGKAVEEYSTEKVAAGFVQERHPRTAVGFRSDGKWVFVVVDGRQANLSIGMTMAELTGLMLELGCKDALNLDGGGSSTAVLEGMVVNSPSDFGVERPVSDAILILKK
jgi:hypothetical protein